VRSNRQTERNVLSSRQDFFHFALAYLCGIDPFDRACLTPLRGDTTLDAPPNQAAHFIASPFVFRGQRIYKYGDP
jgi:hypothetical protein